MNSHRRAFVKAGALTVAFSLAPLARLSAQAPVVLPGSLQRHRRLRSWLRIDAGGTVTFFTGKVELGQGILVALSQIVADELDVDLRRLRVVSGHTALSPDEMFTAGSFSVQDSGGALRQACAEARALLLRAAAARLGVPASDLSVDDGRVSAAQASASTSYWDLAGEVSLDVEAMNQARPKLPAQLRVVGRSVPPPELLAKLTGGEVYVQDLRLPGMVFGRVVRPALPLARLSSVDEASARRLPGVLAVLRDGDFLAVAAQREEQAIAAARQLREGARWDGTAVLPPQGAELFDFMRRQPATSNLTGEKSGPPPPPEARQFSAAFTRPYQAHASIGPSCAVAHWVDGALTVWSHTQGVFALRDDIAKALRIAPAQVTVVHRQGSGCYGHNGADDVALDAALLARALPGRPVKLQWMREDEFTWEPFGSAMAVELRAALDGSGRIVDWNHTLWSYTHFARPGDARGNNLLAAWSLREPQPRAPAVGLPPPAGGGDRNAVPLYSFARHKVTNHLLTETPIRTSALRTLGTYANSFAIESFMDELAAAAGTDPVSFRLKHLDDPRAKAVIEKAAAMAGWDFARAVPRAPADAEGWLRGRGIGFSRYKNSAAYCAAVAEVSVHPGRGELRVHRIVSAVDAGLVINPDGLANQIEGGILQSTSWTLFEALPHDGTQVRARNWGDYPVMRFPQAPRVEVALIDRPELPALGAGEASQGPTVAAIANALADATGRFWRQLPFHAETLRQAA